MKWLTALMLGAILGFRAADWSSAAATGVWMDSWADWGTIRPLAGSPGLLFSIPVFLGAALAFRIVLQLAPQLSA